MARPIRSSQNIIDGPRGPGGSALNNFRHVLEIFFSELAKYKTKTNISIFTSYMQNIIFITDLSKFYEYIFFLENAMRLYYSNP